MQSANPKNRATWVRAIEATARKTVQIADAIKYSTGAVVPADVVQPKTPPGVPTDSIRSIAPSPHPKGGKTFPSMYTKGK